MTTDETEPTMGTRDSGKPQTSERRPPKLSGGQKRHLRGLAHKVRPVVYVGEGGISEAVLEALDTALDSHELVKIRLRQPADKKQAAADLAEASGAALCGVVGHTVVLYRPHPESPRIELPASS